MTADTRDADVAEVDDTAALPTEAADTDGTGAADDTAGESSATPDDAGSEALSAGSASDDDDVDDAEDSKGRGSDDRLVDEGEVAGDYLEQLLDVLDFDGDIDLDVDGDRAIVSIDGGQDLGKLVGKNGEVLDALQELTRLAVQQATGDRSRLMLDVARWRADRRERLSILGGEVAQRVLENGGREELDPMTPFERKIVHDAVAAVDGVMSESEGVEPRRRVVVIKQ